MTDETTYPTNFDPQRYMPVPDPADMSHDPTKAMENAFLGAMVLAFNDYESLATALRAQQESASDVKTKVKHKFETQWADQADKIIQAVAAYLADAFDDSPGLAHAVAEKLGEVKTLTKDYADADIHAASVEIRQDAEVDETLVGVAEQIREQLSNLFTMAQTLYKVSEKTINKAGVKTKHQKVKGGTIATMLDTTRLSTSDRTNVGRVGADRMYRWSIDGEMIEGDAKREIMKKLGVSWSTFTDYIRSKKIEFGGESFELEYKGHKIVASVTKTSKKK